MQELKNQKIWLCWIRRKTRDGKWTKVPISASGGETGTDEAHRDTWVTYEEAIKAARENRYSGVGFVIPEGYFFLDMDHVDLDDPIVRKFMERFKDTYSEVSVSGQGVHFVGKVDLSRIPTYIDKEGKLRLSPEFYQKNSKAKIELYIGKLTNRYSTYSENAINDVPLQDCTEAILETLDQDMRKPGADKSAPGQKPAKAVSGMIRAEEDSIPRQTPEELEAEALDAVCALRKQKNAEKFSDLYDRGDLSGYKSPSEADLALCSLIAFRTGNNPDLIDWIFRRSALYRRKWERAGYRDATIRKAVESCNAGLEDSEEIQLPPFIRLGKKQEPVLIPTRLAKYIRETIHYRLVQDDGMQGTLIYVYVDGAYRLYSREMMLGVIKAPVEEFDEELVSMAKITEVFNLLMTDRVRYTQDQMNADEDVINFRNGLLHLTPGGPVLLPHTPDVFSTIQIPCDWTGEEVPTPVFDDYLSTLTEGNASISRLLWEIMGIVLSNVKCWRLKKSLFLVGPGDTGKSVLKTLMEMILGAENCMAIDLQGIEARFGTGTIYNKRLAGSSDMGYMSVNELKIFKQLTGGDAVQGEFKGQKSFRFVFNGFLWFCMNRIPKFGGDDGKWVYDRILIVQCRNVIPKDKQDKHLLEKLFAESEGILFKAVQALQQVIANGYRLTEPECIAAARDEYQADNNSVIGFLKECMCPRDPGNRENDYSISKVYEAYRNWCRNNNNGYTKTMKEFRDTLAEYFGCSYIDITEHTKDGTCLKYLTLTKEAREEWLGLVA